MLLTTKTLPPGGWVYEQKAADGIATLKKFREFSPYVDFVRSVLAIRSANKLPRATFDEVDEDVQLSTCQRLGNDPRFCAQKKTGRFPFSDRFTNTARLAWKDARKLSSGGQALLDWLGSGGKPVDAAVAQRRVDVCKMCPHNNEANITAWITGPIARAILDQRRAKLGLALAVEGEERLFSCDICLCHLPLKVWVPTDTILEHTDSNTLAQFPTHCWIFNEAPAHLKPTSEPQPIPQPA